MPLKSFQNEASKDNLLSYLGTDKVMRSQIAKMNVAQPGPKAEAEPRKFFVAGKLLTRSEWEARKRRHLRNG